MSINAELVAKDVLKSVKNGERVNLGNIAKKRGYSPATYRNPVNITGTDSYKAIMIPAIQRMENIRNKVLVALENRDLTVEDSRVLKELLDSTTKNIQLLSGKATENVQTSITVVNYSEAESPVAIESLTAEQSSTTVLAHDDHTTQEVSRVDNDV